MFSCISGISRVSHQKKKLELSLCRRDPSVQETAKKGLNDENGVGNASFFVTFYYFEGGREYKKNLNVANEKKLDLKIC